MLFKWRLKFFQTSFICIYIGSHLQFFKQKYWVIMYFDYIEKQTFASQTKNIYGSFY